MRKTKNLTYPNKGPQSGRQVIACLIFSERIFILHGLLKLLTRQKINAVRSGLQSQIYGSTLDVEECPLHFE
jgi:hypothetical protein